MARPPEKKRKLSATQQAAVSEAPSGGLAAELDKKLLVCLTTEYTRSIRLID